MKEDEAYDWRNKQIGGADWRNNPDWPAQRGNPQPQPKMSRSQALDKMFKMLGKGALLQFKNDDKEYVANNVVAEKEWVFVNDKTTQQYSRKNVEDILAINRKAVSLQKFMNEQATFSDKPIFNNKSNKNSKIMSKTNTTEYSAKEKKAVQDLLEAKIERLTGKTVKYIDPKLEAKKTEVKKIHEQLEKLTGKKVVYVKGA